MQLKTVFNFNKFIRSDILQSFWIKIRFKIQKSFPINSGKFAHTYSPNVHKISKNLHQGPGLPKFEFRMEDFLNELVRQDE